MGDTLSQPWRTLPEKNQENLDYVRKYKPRNVEANHLRILLFGPIGAGKSSFINSVDSALQGRITGRDLTDAINAVCTTTTDTNPTASFTKKYRTYKFFKNDHSYYSFVCNDIMGMEETSGVHLEDIKLALRGHVKEGYTFIPGHQLKEEDEGYNFSPSLNDKVHVLVTVIRAGLVSLLSDSIVAKLRDVRLAASEMDIPQIAILTHVDEACPTVNRNTMNIYKSKYLKEQVEKFSQLLGLQLNCIFLVKNYTSEIKTDNDTDAHILCALKQMIAFGEDHLNHLNDHNHFNDQM